MADVDPHHVLRGHFGEVQSLSFLSEQRLFSGDFNGEVHLWDLSSCRAEYTGRLHDTNAGVLHLACLPSYGALVSQGRDGCVKVWALDQTGVPDRPEPLHEAATGSFNFCRFAVWAPGSAPQQAAEVAAGAAAPTSQQQLRGVYLASAAHDPSEVAVWRPAEAANAVVHLRQSPAETKHGMCMSLAFLAPTGEGGAAGNADCSVGDSESSSGMGIGSSSGGSQGGEAAGAGGGPRYLVTGYEDGVAALWDLRSPGRPLGSARLHSEPVMCCDVRPAAARKPKAIAAASAPAGGGEGPAAAVLRAAAAPATPGPSSTPLSYDLVTGSADDVVSCCSLRPAEAQPVRLAKQIKLREAGTADVRIRPDGKLFACGCWDGRTRLYSVRKREPLAVLKYHRNQVTAVAFSPVTGTLATASRDTSVALWSVYTNVTGESHGLDA
ncbi:hypothetical protein HYH02_012044 [Chlamydomonas schloesseri]|uniref:Guanine nucleotide-binding protein subunit beta-like protein n=1 Tax=Chlamydomonas schloesseri TaxID=2026947 RepID=A0A835T101_9CHLO|nr:hypothetical protein HYH02_012044 [Chlamydomonas schloesseri]|eukprot:KAG2435047.1 hypothetical protein HYH02_012044 [Chlamydomonas schloesseri]